MTMKPLYTRDDCMLAMMEIQRSLSSIAESLRKAGFTESPTDMAKSLEEHVVILGEVQDAYEYMQSDD